MGGFLPIIMPLKTQVEAEFGCDNWMIGYADNLLKIKMYADMKMVILAIRDWVNQCFFMEFKVSIICIGGQFSIFLLQNIAGYWLYPRSDQRSITTFLAAKKALHIVISLTHWLTHRQLAPFGIQRHIGTCRDIQGNVGACREYRGIHINTGENIRIHLARPWLWSALARLHWTMLIDF